jgi:transposase
MRVLSDGEWARLKAALDAARSGTGRPFPDERRTVEAMVWRQRNGAKWRPVPPELGPWWKAAQLHIRWSRLGVWEQAFARLRDAGRPDLGEVFLGGTGVRAHREAAGAKGGPRSTPSGARAAATAPKRARPATREGARSASPCCRAKRPN